MEAAPRFELGVGVLQTPALPLGYAAASPDKILVRRRGLCQTSMKNKLNFVNQRHPAVGLP